MSDPLNFIAPSSKSVTQRALIVAALTPGRSSIIFPLECDDSFHLRRALKQLGVSIEEHDGEWTVQGGILHAPEEPIFCGDAGTTLRFLMAFSLLMRGEMVFDGSPQLRARSVERYCEALESLGVKVEYLKEKGCIPLRLTRGQLPRSTVSLSMSQSSQPASALLMVAPLLPFGLVIQPESDAVSMPYVKMTCKVMEHFGVKVECGGRAFQVGIQGYIPQRFEVEGDWSSASFLFAASFITGVPVEVLNLEPDSLQGDRGIVRMLEDLARPGKHVFDLSGSPDLIAPLTVAALYSKSQTEIVGAGHARLKESNRIATLVEELSKLGCSLHERPDGLLIYPGAPTRPADLNPRGDHRMAMAFGLISLKFPRIHISGHECVSKSYPGFWGDIERFRAAAEPEV